jgi:hypothetical protein
MQQHQLPEGWDKDWPVFPADAKGNARSGRNLDEALDQLARLARAAVILRPELEEDEVIEQQSLEVRQFLGRTSILHRFSASLCNTVLGTHNAQEILLYLEQANLFLVSLDNRRGWYRYHHLFGEMLRSRLHQKRPEINPGVPTVRSESGVAGIDTGASGTVRHAQSLGESPNFTSC